MNTDDRRLLALAEDWRAGRIAAVHPSIGRVLNQALTASGQDAVPFGRSTNSRAQSLTDLIRAEYECAPGGRNAPKSEAAKRFARQMSESVHGGSRVGSG